LIFRASFFATLPGVSTILFLKAEKPMFSGRHKKAHSILISRQRLGSRPEKEAY